MTCTPTAFHITAQGALPAVATLGCDVRPRWGHPAIVTGGTRKTSEIEAILRSVVIRDAGRLVDLALPHPRVVVDTVAAA